MDGHFVKGGVNKPTLKAKHATDKDLDILLPTSLDTKYDIEQLDTSGLETSYNGYTITWVNNFKLKVKKNAKILATKVAYEVQFQKPDLGGLSNEHLFIYDGSSIVMVNSADYTDLGDGKIAARLREVDPAVGWGGS
jgi:hypothetical protein